jgi:hypothetical protein
MNTETSYPLTDTGVTAANDAEYKSPAELGRIERVCRLTAGMSVLTVVVSGQIAVPGAIFAAAVLGFYLVLTTIVGLDPFYALVGKRQWARLASVSTLSLGAVLTGQIATPETIAVMGFVGAITGLLAVQQTGASPVAGDEAHSVSTEGIPGVGAVYAEGSDAEGEAMSSRRVA